MVEMESGTDFGVGIYSVQDSARLLRRPAAQIRRWANGYTYRNLAKESIRKLPVLQSQRGDSGYLNFRELIELFYVREFTTLGVSLEQVRAVSEKLVSEFGAFPFASARLLVSGRNLMRVSELGIISVETCQLVSEIVTPFLQEITFGEEWAIAWTPAAGNGSVIVDPNFKYGEPILKDTGTPTRSVFNLYIKEQDMQRVADWFDIQYGRAKDAVEFEMHFSNVA
jgi:hypothetical protein